MLLEEAISLCSSSEWSSSISHVFREANSYADILASMGHHGGFQWMLLEEMLTQLSLALVADARGVSSVRIVH